MEVNPLAIVVLHAQVFNMPHEADVARMLRDDLADARKTWLNEAQDDPQEYVRRIEDDFPADRQIGGIMHTKLFSRFRAARP